MWIVTCESLFQGFEQLWQCLTVQEFHTSVEEVWAALAVLGRWGVAEYALGRFMSWYVVDTDEMWELCWTV